MACAHELCVFPFLAWWFVPQMEVLEMLVQNGADLNAKTKHDETPAGKGRFAIGIVCFGVSLCGLLIKRRCENLLRRSGAY